MCATAFPTVTDTPDGHRRHGVHPQTPGEDAAAASLPESAASATWRPPDGARSAAHRPVATDDVNRDPSMPRKSDELKCATTLLRRKLWGNTPAG